jgi:hypothetical protein
MSESIYDKANRLGQEYALDEHAGGATEPQGGPLSGEWADGLLPSDVFFNVMDRGFNPRVDGVHLMSDLADEWEKGYWDRWQIITEEMKSWPTRSTT